MALPVGAYYTWKGSSLEGRGVQRHVAEPILPTALGSGQDNQLARALDIL